MAGQGFRTFASGEVLTAANVNGYLMEQAVMVFASASARSTALAAPSEGMISYLTDTNAVQFYDGAAWVGIIPSPTVIAVAVSDETTNITTGTAKVTFRMPFAMTVTAVRASLATASTSGTPTFDINESGSSILGTKLSIDANEKTSTTAASAATITDSALADDAEITIDIDVAGTGARGAKVYLIGTRA